MDGGQELIGMQENNNINIKKQGYMKKSLIKTIMTVMAAAFALTACTDEFATDSGLQKPQRQLTGGDKLAIEVIMADDEPSTRMEYSVSNNVIRSGFEEGDVIGVYAMNGTTLEVSNVPFTYADGIWVPSTEVEFNPDWFYYAYFPYKSNATLTSEGLTFASAAAPNPSSDDCNVKFADFIEEWPIAVDQSTKAAFTASDLLAARGVNQVLPVVRFTMAHKLALAEIVPSYNKYFFDYDPMTKLNMAITFSGNLPYAFGDAVYYIMRPATPTVVGGQTLSASAGKYRYSRIATISDTYTLSYDTDLDGSYDDALPSWLSITDSGETNKSLQLSMTHSSTTNISGWTAPAGASDIDLSMVDVSGNANASGRTTANSYMVHMSGTYKIPLVYGNAIKDGAANTVAYAPGGYESPTYLSAFVNHTGAAITDPWLKNNSATPDAAELLWQDNTGIISAVGISGDYLTFTVKAGAPMGNAVIAAKKSGVVVWSWHIWVCPDLYSDAALATIGSAHSYQLTPVNLGWVGNLREDVYNGGTCRVKMTPTGETGVEQTFEVSIQPTKEYYPISVGRSPYYQYSRKDPEIPSAGTGNTNLTVYDISGTATTGLIFSEFTDDGITIADGIKNPTTHFYNNTSGSSAQYGPYNTAAYNLWDATLHSTGNISTATVKTIYDPCPPGFCVPSSNIWYYMTKGSSNDGSDGSNHWDTESLQKGRIWTKTFPKMYFPAAGRRYSNSGALYGVGSDGYFWSSSPYGGSRGHRMSMDSSYFGWYYGYRAYGFTVRPVLEE